MTTRVRTSIHDENISSFNKKWTEKLIHIERKYRFACVRRIFFSLFYIDLCVDLKLKIEHIFWNWSESFVRRHQRIIPKHIEWTKIQAQTQKPAENNTQQNKAKQKMLDIKTFYGND